jgi:pimeloyl-ACP methyl ester carboxylesterase
MNVVVDGLMTAYQKSGKGKPVILLHGWGDDSRTFLPLTEKLKGSYSIYTLDLPGFGGTQPPPSAWGLDEYADFFEAWLKKLKLKPYSLVGHSYGGAIAVTAAGRGQIANKLVLLAAAGIRNKRPVRKKLLTAGAKAGKLPLLLLPAQKRQAVKEKFYGSIGSDLMVVPHMQETFRRIINQDVRLMANQIEIPTLLIYGSLDQQTPLHDGHLLNRSIKGSRLEIIKAGHFLHQEEAEKVGRIINEFLKER